MTSSDIQHAAATHGVEIVSEVDYDEKQNIWKFQGVNYKNAETTAREYAAFREEGYGGIRIRQIRQRTGD
jgi:hypothetical protein